jgi:hypothetical protein
MQNNRLLTYFKQRGRGLKRESPSVRNGEDIKILSTICLLLVLVTSAPAKEQTSEEMANSILSDRIALCLRIGKAKPTDDVFLMELDVNTFQAALDSTDMRLKVLVAVRALKTMPHSVKEGEQPLSEREKRKRFRENPQYKKLKECYIELIHKNK